MIDLNSDLGEGLDANQLENDRNILEVVTSANIACGFHAGNSQIMSRTVQIATELNVAIGAHVSYDDREGFGRRDIEVTPDKLRSDILYQIEELHTIAETFGNRVKYVKPHGALYNRIAIDETQARIVVESIIFLDPSLILLTLPDSVAMRIAHEMGLLAVAEGYADRAYTSDGNLVSRRIPGAVINDTETVVSRATQMAREGTVTCIDGQTITIDVRSISLHSDTEGAEFLSRKIREGLESAGVVISAFV